MSPVAQKNAPGNLTLPGALFDQLDYCEVQLMLKVTLLLLLYNLGKEGQGRRHGPDKGPLLPLNTGEPINAYPILNSSILFYLPSCASTS